MSFSGRTLLHADTYLYNIMFVAVHLKRNGQKFFRALTGFIILEISLEMRTVLCLV